MNKVVLTGRITKDPEIRYTQNGLSNLRFSVAVDRQVKDASGNRQADFVSCVAFGQQAEFMARFIRKGFMICVEGRIQTGQYQDQNNQVHYTTDVVVERVENLQPRDPNAAPAAQGFQQPQPQYQQNPYQGYNNPTYGQNQQPQPQYQQPRVDSTQTFNVDVADDDLPF